MTNETPAPSATIPPTHPVVVIVGADRIDIDPADFSFLLDCAEVGLEGAPEFDQDGNPDPGGKRADWLWALVQRLRGNAT